MSIYNLSYPPGVQSAIQTTLDSMMGLEGRNCILYFPPIPSPNSGSINAPIGTDISNNIWSAGMPQPIHSQQNYNPYADGQGFIQIEQTGVITMVIYPNPTKFNNLFPIGERKDEGLIVTRGYVSDLTKVLNCTRMETYIEAGTNHYKYKLDGEPVMPGTLIPTRYFYALWSRV